jgi:hypothetical protein
MSHGSSHFWSVGAVIVSSAHRSGAAYYFFLSVKYLFLLLQGGGEKHCPACRHPLPRARERLIGQDGESLTAHSILCDLGNAGRQRSDDM